MQALGVSTVDAYLSSIELRPSIKEECEKLLTVSISRFFRDRLLWEGLEREVLPMLLSATEDGAPFKAWSCGCARGEEPYSFKIVWERMKNRSEKLPQLQLQATDTNPEYLRMAAEGIYDLRSLKEIPEPDREKWFDTVPGKKKKRVKPFLKKGVFFERRDFRRDSPPSRDFHLVFARNNLLTYYLSPERDAVFARIANALRNGGALIIGSHEKIPETSTCLKRHPKFGWVYLKKVN